MSVLQIATIARTQDITAIKHNEDNKTFIQQTTISHEQQKDTQQRAREVRQGEHSEWQNKKFDAKEKGANEYSGNGGKKRHKQENVDGVVIKKQQGFDMKI